MYVQVRLLKGYQKVLTYKIPDSWTDPPKEGSVITVPLKNKIVPALVTSTHSNLPLKTTFAIKEAIGNDKLPQDSLYSNFIKSISQFYFIQPKVLYQRIRSFVYSKEDISILDTSVTDTRIVDKGIVDTSIPDTSVIDTHGIDTSVIDTSVILTSEQQDVVEYIKPYIVKPEYKPTLIYGVTGSGKTEIYKKVIQKCFSEKKSVLLLLPEVSLCLQFERLLKLSLSIPIFGFHSASRASEKKELWNSLVENKSVLIIGVHLPPILPVTNLGCIIVDEEHESGFQEKKHPKINSKEIAIWRAKLYNIPIILGSATPSLNSIHSVDKYGWKLFRLTKRFSGKFPTIKIVKIKDKDRRDNFWITKNLQNAISDRLTKKEQILIFINRRGYSFFVKCKNCGFTFLCPNCSVSLTPHKTTGGTELCCHYCDYTQNSSKICPKCKAPEEELLNKGIGTQQAVDILEKLFPNARIARADLDTTKKKRLWHDTVEKFENGELDILVGTQTITKGYHFPKVTLVGILWADLNAHFPIFNASETALQQLIQVAGRAGRQSNESLVLVQIMHEHYIFNHLQEENYLEFCKEEMAFREETNYPPFGRFVQIELKSSNVRTLELEAKQIFDLLSKNNMDCGVTVLGPVKPLVYRIQNREIRHIFMKSKDFAGIYKLLSSVKPDEWQSQVCVIPTP